MREGLSDTKTTFGLELRCSMRMAFLMQFNAARTALTDLKYRNTTTRINKVRVIPLSTSDIQWQFNLSPLKSVNACLCMCAFCFDDNILKSPSSLCLCLLFFLFFPKKKFISKRVSSKASHKQHEKISKTTCWCLIIIILMNYPEILLNKFCHLNTNPSSEGFHSYAKFDAVSRDIY